MPRPRKCRRVCHLPPVGEFSPVGGENEYIVLTVDEYECIRLADHLGLSQEECVDFLQASRATAQLICERARKKLASALVEGKGIRIEGGEFRLCDGKSDVCKAGCKRHCRHREGQN